jgi:hypothetical protein
MKEMSTRKEKKHIRSETALLPIGSISLQISLVLLQEEFILLAVGTDLNKISLCILSGPTT